MTEQLCLILMVGLNGYTLCSGIICEELNGDNYCAVKLDSDERMEIGYISRKGAVVSAIGQKYLEKYRNQELCNNADIRMHMLTNRKDIFIIKILCTEYSDWNL